MDVKIDKGTLLADVNLIMQKLSLKVWNECCQIFLQKESEQDS